MSAAGPARTPHAFRTVCTDFLDFSTLPTEGDRPAAGKHRAT